MHNFVIEGYSSIKKKTTGAEMHRSDKLQVAKIKA